MFRAKDMVKALSWLIGLYKPEDYDSFDEEEYGVDGGLCLFEVALGLRDTAQSIYQYTMESSYELGFEYRGKELFNQRGCKIYTAPEFAVSDIANILYHKELWLLEDMSFAIVHCVVMSVGNGQFDYITEYRAIVKRLVDRNDLFMKPEQLLEEFEEICIPQWEHTATIYEL
ncbi:MAG: hypothetical protein RR565_10570 [Erysipelothrix sp.]